jgi:V8-like Glu-specific endopeptidase
MIVVPGVRYSGSDLGPVDDAKTPPYQWTGQLVVRFPLGIAVGAGVLLNPFTVLTAGHNIFLPKLGGEAEGAMFTLAENGGEVSPALPAQVKHWTFAPAIQNGRFTKNALMESCGLDYALLHLDAPQSLAAYPEPYAVPNDELFEKYQIAGYPGSLAASVMYYAQGIVRWDKDLALLWHRISTYPGCSGGGVMSISAPWRTIGIHSRADDRYATAVRITEDLRDWILWETWHSL